MEFSGFTQDDFEVFEIEDFAGRMGALRARIRPKLVALGADLAGPVEEILGLPSFPHAAQHMRRRVNPPAETWVAFCRDKKGYKRWTHTRIAISGSGVRVTVFVEDDADDKTQFGASLERAPGRLLSLLEAAPVEWYTADPGAMDAEKLAKLGAGLQKLKTAKFQAGISLHREAVLALTPEKFEGWALEQTRVLRPLYLAGATADFL